MTELEKLVTRLGSDTQVLHDTCVKYTWDTQSRDFWSMVLRNDITHVVKTILAIDEEERRLEQFGTIEEFEREYEIVEEV